MDAFHRLHPRLRHAIVNDLGWRSLRPVQNLAANAILDGSNAVVLAPTAGGKTEAAIFPVLSRILSEDLAPVAALYVCPIRALLNNQEPRLEQYTRMVGLDVFKWHGDVADSQKSSFRREPRHVLMITPESLEVMLISDRTDARFLFAGLSAVIVDEVHAFAADDRGAHLVSILERLTQFCGRDVQRIGLSATVGNPGEIGRWLQGSSRRSLALIDPPRVAAGRDLRIERCEEIGEAAHRIAAQARGRKSLVFVESRAGAEKVVRALKGRGVDVFIHHSSVSRADRARAEAEFAEGRNVAIVATSTMELGIDVGDLDHVVQVDAPSSVASFLQRIGRTGRRPGTRSNCTFYCLTAESLLQVVALLTLAERGWVEDVVPADQAMHVLAHQVLALTLQEGGLSRWRVLPWLAAAAPFAGLTEERVQALVQTMLDREILHESDGLLSLGVRGERLYGRKNFFELYAVFSSPPVLTVLHGRDEIGLIEARFAQGIDENGEVAGPVVFRLAGRAWRVEHVDYARGRMQVKPAEGGRVPSWLGQPTNLSLALCQEILRVLVEEQGEAAWLSEGAAEELRAVRDGYCGILEVGTAPLEYTAEGVQWHTFAGGAVNRLLAAAMAEQTGKKWVAGNLSVKSKDSALAEARAGVRGLATVDWEAMAVGVAAELARGQLSKFQPCLPADEEERLLVGRLLDVPATLAFLARTRVHGIEVAAPGPRLDDAALTVEVATLLRTRLPSGYARPVLPITYVETAEALAAAADALFRAAVVGLDVETVQGPDVLCLVQLAVEGRTYVIDAVALPNLRPLGAVLENDAVIKVVHYASFERTVLAKHGFELRNVVDTHERSRTLRGDVLGGHSLASVCERELGLRIDKTEQTGAWAARPLTVEQLAYAALDAEVLLMLYERFRRPNLRLV